VYGGPPIEYYYRSNFGGRILFGFSKTLSHEERETKILYNAAQVLT